MAPDEYIKYLKAAICYYDNKLYYDNRETESEKEAFMAYIAALSEVDLLIFKEHMLTIERLRCGNIF